jgi:hypothetical protein
MIFIIRTNAGGPPPLDIKMTRKTPAIVANGDNTTDYFCLGDPEEVKDWPVVPVHDGWYADDNTGGMAIWGQGMFWEVRDTPFTIKQACGSEAWSADPTLDPNEAVNVRQAIFRG